MLFQFSNVLIFAAVGIAFILMALTLSRLVRPVVEEEDKLTSYECGELPEGGAWINFNIRFYVVALVFLIFDVEVVLMYPVATVFKGWIHRGSGSQAFVEIIIFVAILLVGLAYVWAKGDLEWVKQVMKEEK
jgi:NADH-quinone oxidoreductase subunit A